MYEKIKMEKRDDEYHIIIYNVYSYVLSLWLNINTKVLHFSVLLNIMYLDP